jgi:hypothetical protein
MIIPPLLHYRDGIASPDSESERRLAARVLENYALASGALKSPDRSQKSACPEVSLRVPVNLGP